MRSETDRVFPQVEGKAQIFSDDLTLINVGCLIKAIKMKAADTLG